MAVLDWLAGWRPVSGCVMRVSEAYSAFAPFGLLDISMELRIVSQACTMVVVIAAAHYGERGFRSVGIVKRVVL